MEYYPSSGGNSRPVEKEVAAALESVFPRVGIKAFAELGPAQREQQLQELCTIVLGIRVFNKSQGMGGEGIDNVNTQAVTAVRQLQDQLQDDVDNLERLCAAYQNALVKAHRRRRVASRASKRTPTPEEVAADPALDDEVLDRWAEELANRRQFLTFSQTLLQQVRELDVLVSELAEKCEDEIRALAELLGNQGSVPKDQVYPRFDQLAKVWMELFQQMKVVESKQRVQQLLAKFRQSFTPHLSSIIYGEQVADGSFAESVVLADSERVQYGVGRSDPSAPSPLTAVSSRGPASSRGSSTARAPSGLAVNDEFMSDNESGDFDVLEFGEGANRSPSAVDHFPLPESSAEVTLVDIRKTPEFAKLPLEFQGFCPWTFVRARGLLVLGDPGLGIVQYRNSYYVFAHKVKPVCIELACVFSVASCQKSHSVECAGGHRPIHARPREVPERDPPQSAGASRVHPAAVDPRALQLLSSVSATCRLLSLRAWCYHSHFPCVVFNFGTNFTAPRLNPWTRRRGR